MSQAVGFSRLQRHLNSVDKGTGRRGGHRLDLGVRREAETTEVSGSWHDFHFC